MKGQLTIYISGLLFISLCAVVWIVRLRRAFDKRTAELQHELELRRSSEADLQGRNEELAAAEHEFHLLFDRMLNGFALHEIICDSDGKPSDYRFLEVNESYERLTGLKRADILGRTVREVLPGLEEYWVERFGAVALNGVPDHFENYVQALGRWYEVLAYSPKHGQFAVTISDITERIQMERALKLTQFSVDSAAEAVFWLVSDGRFVYVNDAACSLLGYSRAELLSLSAHEMSPDYPPESWTARWVELKGQGSMTFEATVLTRDGHEILVEITSNLIEFNGREYNCAFVRDITDRKRAEARMHELAEGISAARGDTFFLAIVRQMGRLLGMEYAFVGEMTESNLESVQTVAVYAHGNLAENFEYKLVNTPCENIVKTGVCFYPEGVAGQFPKDAMLVEMGVECYIGVPLHGTDGRILGLMALMDRRPLQNREIVESMLTIFVSRVAGELERKKAEKEIRKLNAELEQRVADRTAELAAANEALKSEVEQRSRAQEEITWLNDDLQRQKEWLVAANQELESFSYSVSHDLRAPLRHIIGFSNLLCEEYRSRLDDAGWNYLDRVCKAGQRMEMLIDALLKLAHVSRGELEYRSVNLSNLAREIASELEQAHPGRSADVVIADGVIVRGDPRLLRIVMVNLMGNAWKYSGRRDTAEIEFGMTYRDGRKAYFVRDNGAGFDMTYADRLFGAFQRLHNMDEFEGSGIGLATVRRIIHRHGGHVWAEGNVDKGATFYFTLPD